MSEALLAHQRNLYTATDPQASVWVSANAGAGKTRLLTSRVLRLLLSGVIPSRIVCITYTTAAAVEMKERIYRELSKWAVASAGELDKQLVELNGFLPDIPTRARARTLFTLVLEAPEGLRIQTIHAFCQSLLKRFPLEAGTQPYFSVIDERTSAELVREAAMRLYLRSEQAGKDDPISDALRFMAGRLSESSFRELINELINERRHLRSMLNTPGGIAALERALYNALNLPPRGNIFTLTEAAFNYTPEHITLLRQAALQASTGSGKGEPEKARIMAAWLEAPGSRVSMLDDYTGIFLTKSGEPRASIFNKATVKDEAVKDALFAEQARVLAFQQQCNALRIAETSAKVMQLAEGLIGLYEMLKAQRAALDYDDLILTARDLLESPGIAPWVLYKLDGGIDHILLDEAQDTAPEQWQIVSALADEFFSGKSAREDVERTLFVVGDEKQSIYRFQGADPDAFREMRAHFREQIQNAGKWFVEVDLLYSYRSAAPVLAAVDAVFQDSLTGAALRHELTRAGEAGRVEFWPLMEPDEKEEAATWELPLTLKQSQQPAQKLAYCLSETIAGWLAEGRELPSKSRPVQPGDIMILVRKRSSFVDTLIKSLKRKGVPVAGTDRMVLTENLAAQDMMALARFLLLESDDLSLAELLRSPMFDISEEQLFTLAHGREKSLWQRLVNISLKDDVFAQCVSKLTAWRQKMDDCTPYSLFAHVLDACGMRRKITGRMGEEYNDALDEFLNQALAFESQYTPTLQGFIHWITRANAIVKRDMEHGANEVRIMTIHGAKGLQAPIVFLPDTAQPPRAHERLLWHEREGEPDLVFWCPASKGDHDLTAALRADNKAANLREYKRLLYVAMTRAEDELYICGYRGRDAAKDDAWYQMVKQSFEALATPCQSPCGEGLRLETAQQKELKSGVDAKGRIQPADSAPEFLYRNAPAENLSAFLLSAEKSAKETPVFSPLTQGETSARGEVICKSLKYVSHAAAGFNKQEITRLVARSGVSFSGVAREQMIDDIAAFLFHSEWSYLFQREGASVDVPISGMVELAGLPVPVSGQIDRLVVREREVWVMDFEPHREPPLDMASIPEVDLRRLASLRALVSRIYPEKQIRVAMVWTAIPLAMEIPRAFLPF